MSERREHTTVRAYGVLIEESRVLLVRSSSPEFQPPLWWLPGGGLDFGETPEQALAREFAEETGLEITHPTLLGVTSDLRRRDNGDRLHTVRIHYRVGRRGGTLRDETSGTTDQTRWFPLGELDGANVAAYARVALSLAAEK